MKRRMILQNAKSVKKDEAGQTAGEKKTPERLTAQPESGLISKSETKAAPEMDISPKKRKVSALRFEEDKPKAPSKLRHVSETVRSAGDELHRQIASANEDDNTAVDAVLQGEQAVSQSWETGEKVYDFHQDRKERKAEKAADKLKKSDAAGTASPKTLSGKSSAGTDRKPVFSSNPISRWQQRQAIRQEYAAAKAGKSTFRETARSAGEAVKETGSVVTTVTDFFAGRKTIVGVLGLIALLIALLSSLQSCSPIAQSVLQALVIGTYPAEESAVLAAEQAYEEKENTLRDELEHYTDYHPEYDEVSVEADEIGHDPYVLIAVISAYLNGEEWTIEQALPVIETYFSAQYVVTVSSRTETRYRTETVTEDVWVTDENGRTGHWETVTQEVQVPYDYTIATVKMENKNLSHLPVYTMSTQQLGLYALYMSTHGNMEGIFEGYANATPLRDPTLYDIPQETLDADPVFAKIAEEANKYIGYPYIWGGSSPETSFDCSGFVCWVYTNSGVYDTGRLGATGLHDLCREVSEEELKPGDIVFFEGTMGSSVSGITHCGIYVGNHMMIHCGSPISYADLTDSYWVQHFHSYGRIPY